MMMEALYGMAWWRGGGSTPLQRYQATARVSEEPLTQCSQSCSQGNSTESIVRQQWENRKPTNHSENLRGVIYTFRPLLNSPRAPGKHPHPRRLKYDDAH